MLHRANPICIFPVLLSGVLLTISPALADAQESLEPIQIVEEREKSEDPLSSGTSLETTNQIPSQTLGGTLEGIPGLITMGAGGEGRRKQISIRGLSNQQVQILWEGIPLNTSLGGGVDLSQIPVWGEEQIDVYRGGNGLLGANALGGALHVFAPGVPTTAGASLSVRGGGFGSIGGRLSVQEGGEHWGVRTGIESTRRDGDFSFIDHNGQPRVRNHNGSLDWSWTGAVYGHDLNGHHLRLNTWVHESIRQMPGAEQFPTPDALMTQTRQLGAFTWNPDFRPLGLQQMSVWSHRRTSEYLSSSSFLGGQVRNEMEALSHGARVHLRWIPTPWMSPSWSVDGSGERAQIALTGVRSDRHRAQAGTGIAVDTQFLEDKVLFTPGIRLEWLSDQEMVILPKAGAQFRPWSMLTMTVNGSRSYRPPTFEELYFEQGSVRGNPDLNSESGWNLDADIRLGTQKYWVRVGAYAIWIDNLILFLPTSAFVLEATDSKSATSRGLEGEASVSISPNLALRSGYTFTDARFSDSGEALPFRSPHMATGTLHWHREGTRAELSMVWRSSFPMDRFGQLREEERIQLDAELKHQFSSEFSMLLEGHNLLDKKDAVDDLLQPLPGRTIFVTTTITL